MARLEPGSPIETHLAYLSPISKEHLFGCTLTPTRYRFDPLSQADVTKGPEALAEAMKGVDAVIILTSATPKMRMPPPQPPNRPEFYYPEGGLPQMCAPA